MHVCVCRSIASSQRLGGTYVLDLSCSVCLTFHTNHKMHNCVQYLLTPFDPLCAQHLLVLLTQLQLLQNCPLLTQLLWCNMNTLPLLLSLPPPTFLPPPSFPHPLPPPPLSPPPSISPPLPPLLSLLPLPSLSSSLVSTACC